MREPIPDEARAARDRDATVALRVGAIGQRVAKELERIARHSGGRLTRSRPERRRSLHVYMGLRRAMPTRMNQDTGNVPGFR